MLFCALLAVAPTPAFGAEPAIAFGTRHAVMLRTNGDVLTWGDNVFCELGRATSSNRGRTPEVMLRNVKEIAAASEHSLALTVDGKVYGWGMNGEGPLGTGDTYDKCEGPALVPSLAGKTIVHIATGYGFSVAVTSTGDLYCSGDNSMGQCPAAKGGRSDVFIPVGIAELAGRVAAVRAGSFHSLILTKDGKLYALGRGRDGQLGTGKAVNGFGLVPDMTDVVSFAAGTWHSIAVRGDGSVWTWGNGSKSQLCDGGTANRLVPAKVDLPDKIAQVAAGGHGTLLKASDGALLVCGDNQFGPLGLEGPPLVPVPRPTRVPGAVVKGALATGGAHSAFSPDGCSVRITGDNDQGIVSAAGADSRVFIARADASLCAPAPASPLPDLVRVWPSGGASGCWTPRVQENQVTNPKWAPLRETLLDIEALFKKNPAFMSAPEPSRWRTTIAAGPQNESGAQLHIKVVHERKADGTRVWTGECDVIPQVDRIGGAIAQISIYINEDPRGRFIGPVGEAPKRTGTVAGFPEYNGAVYITKDNRVSWIPQTLDDKLTVEGARRETALAEWTKSRAEMKGMDEAAIQKAYDALKKTDPAGADRFVASVRQQNAELQRLQQEVYPLTTAELQKQVSDYRQYRASFTPEQLRAPAVWGDPAGEARKRLDARIAELQALTPEEQAQTRQPGADTRLIRQRHLEKAGPLLDDARAQYNLTNLRPGAAAQAMSVKPDPAFPDFTTPNRIQSITILFSFGDPKDATMAAWGARTKETFDFAALAALIK